MNRKTRKQELIEIARDRLDSIERLLLLPPLSLSDKEFDQLKREAVKLRDMLKML